MPRPTRRICVECTPNANGLSQAIVKRVVSTVLDGENTGSAEFSVTFLSAQRMRALNRRLFGADRATDVIAFGLPHPDVLVGDIYVCPSVARRSARDLKLSESEELLRLVVHGTLHSLGYDHPSGAKRSSSKMWRKQERYLKTITKSRS